MVRKAMASRTWPSTKALIEEAGEKNGAGDGYSVTELKYSYEFGGVRYFGSRISYRLILSGLPDLRQIEPGKTLTAFVNPDLPVESVLVPGPNTYNWIFLGITVALMVASLGSLVAVLYSSEFRCQIRDGWVETDLF